MRISKKRLRQIIQEELRIINEQIMDVPLRGDPSVIARQHRPQSVKDSDARAAQDLEDAVDDFLDALAENADLMDGLSLAAKGVGIGLVAFPEPSTTAAGMAILKGSTALDALAAIGYTRQEDYNAAAFSALGAVASARAGDVMKFYKQLVRLRNKVSKNKPILYLLKKKAPAWAWVGITLSMETSLQTAEAGLEHAMSEEDQDTKGIEKIKAYIKDVEDNLEFLEQVEMAEDVQDFYHTQTGY